MHSSKTIFSVLKIIKILKTFSSDEKVIFFSNQNFANIISFFILYNFSNIKHVIFERNHIDEFTINENLWDFFKKYVIKFLIKILYDKANLVVGNANVLSRDLSTLAKTKVKTIYNPAYDKSIIKLSKKKIKSVKKKNIILNVGRLEKQKDQLTILKAIKNIENIFLIIIGYGTKKSELNNFIIKNKLNDKVLILENIDNPYPYFKISSLFVLSSLYEGFPNVLTEAIMFKIPIISSNCNSGPAEILMKKNGPQLFEVGNSHDLEKKIRNFFKNKKIIKRRTSYLHSKLNRFEKKLIIEKFDKSFQSLFK